MTLSGGRELVMHPASGLLAEWSKRVSYCRCSVSVTPCASLRLPEQGVDSEQKVGLRSNCESEKQNRLTNEEEEKSKRKHNSESQS